MIFVGEAFQQVPSLPPLFWGRAHDHAILLREYQGIASAQGDMLVAVYTEIKMRFVQVKEYRDPPTVQVDIHPRYGDIDGAAEGAMHGSTVFVIGSGCVVKDCGGSGICATVSIDFSERLPSVKVSERLPTDSLLRGV